jgi:hypothetical protein
MKLKIILITLGIVLIIGLALFGTTIKEKALKGMVQDIAEYNCGKDDICTSCIIDGHTCSCGTHTCSCGNETVDRTECELYG